MENFSSAETPEQIWAWESPMNSSSPTSENPKWSTKPPNSANIQPSEPIGPNTEGRVSIDNLPWIIGGIGLALIGLALFFYWRSTQATEAKVPPSPPLKP